MHSLPARTNQCIQVFHSRSSTLNIISLWRCTGSVWGGRAPSEAGKFCRPILETESCNLVNSFRYKFNKTMKTKFKFYGLNRRETDQPKLRIMGSYGITLYWRHYTGHPPASIKGIYPHPSTPMILHRLGSLNKRQVYLRLCRRRRPKCKAQCRTCWRARAGGSGKFWNIDAI